MIELGSAWSHLLCVLILAGVIGMVGCMGLISSTGPMPNNGSSSPSTTTPLPAQLSANSPGINFGTVLVGSQTQSGTVTNSGGSTAKISQTSLTGSGFTVTGLNLPLTLKAGDSAQFNITFAPQSSGAITGTITFDSDAANKSLSVALSGTGAAPGSLTPAPLSIGFGNVALGTSQSTTETVTNSGGSGLTISQATPTGSGFSLSGLSLPTTLSPGQSTTFNVTFAPQASGLATGASALSATDQIPGSIFRSPDLAFPQALWRPIQRPYPSERCSWEAAVASPKRSLTPAARA